MTDEVLNRLRKTATYRYWDILESWIPAILFCIIISIAAAWWDVYEFDTDEGVNLGKAMLVANGYHIYADVWNDQPPLLTYALAILEYWFPGRVIAGRILVLVCASLLLRSLFRIVCRQNGPLAAWMAIVSLAAFSMYPKLSVSVMVGLPAIALAIIAFDVVSGPPERRRSHLFIGGVLFGLSLQVKFFTLAAAPAFCLALYLAWANNSLSVRVGALILGLFGAVISYGLVAWAVELPVMSQVVAPHITPELRSVHTFSGSFQTISRYLSDDRWILFLGIAGVFSLWFGPWRSGIVPFVWFMCAFVALLLHTPVWPHHMLLLVVPLAWLAGIFAGQLKVFLAMNLARPKLTLIIPLLFLVLASSTYRAPIGHSDIRDEAAMQALLVSPGIGNGWVLSDRPMDAFRARLMVPPEVVVFSSKRRSAGNLNPSDILNSLRRRRPNQVLLRRFSIDPMVRDFLEKNYQEVPNAHGYGHYVISTPVRY